MSRAAIPFALVLLALPVPAAARGEFTAGGTQPAVTSPTLPPGACRGCHGDYDPAENLEQYDTWAGSMMANAGRDPLFWAAVDVANNDLAGVGEFCLRCHAPTAFLAGRVTPPEGSADGCALDGELDQPNNDFAGVSCHFCHRMMVNPDPPPGEDSVYFENAKAWIDDEFCNGPGTGPCRRGPYDYSGDDVPPLHDWAFSPYHQSSDLCGNCHNVTSPALNLIDEDGTDTGVPYPIERTFKEWQQSDFAVDGDGFATCQNCHMPDAEVDPAYACLQAENNRTGDLPMHRMAGGNAWIPEVLRGDYPALGRDAELANTAAWALDLLLNQSATVELAAISPPVAGGGLTVEVRVTNLTGHKLPTGYPEGRRMWLHVAARDGADDLIWESGAYDGATGELTEDEQIKIYHVEPGIWNRNGTGECDAADGGGNPIFHFVLNNCFVVDNRIPPLGFTGGDDLETRPVGYVYPETAPGSGVLVHYDRTAYAIPIPAAAVAPITVEATLYYQTASREYVEFLRDQAVTHDFPDDCIPRTDGLPGMSRGELLHDMWTRYDRSPPVAMGAEAVALELAIFADGFESGDTAAWTNTVP